MIQSTGQILTGKAAKDLVNVITNTSDNDGFYRAAYKALIRSTSPKINEVPAGPSLVNGTWCEIAGEGKENDFLGVVGDDTSPEANVNLDSRKPVLEFGSNFSVPTGGVVTIERNGMISVIASGDITEGDLLALGPDGSFKTQATPDASTAVGRAYEDATNGNRFVAFIKAL